MVYRTDVVNPGDCGADGVVRGGAPRGFRADVDPDLAAQLAAEKAAHAATKGKLAALQAVAEKLAEQHGANAVLLPRGSKTHEEVLDSRDQPRGDVLERARVDAVTREMERGRKPLA